MFITSLSYQDVEGVVVVFGAAKSVTVHLFLCFNICHFETTGYY